MSNTRLIAVTNHRNGNKVDKSSDKRAMFATWKWQCYCRFL